MAPVVDEAPARPGRPRRTGRLAGLSGTYGLAVLATYLFFVRTTRGQLVDAAALDGHSIGRSRLVYVVDGVVSLVSISTLVLATGFIAFVALARRRVAVAVAAVGIVGGAIVATELLKNHLLTRPELTPVSWLGPLNTFPSGHTTVAMSVAVALVLVVPASVRAVTALGATAYGALTGVATLSGGWHRPSDAIAACLVVGGAAAAVLAALSLLPRRGSVEPRAAPVAVTALSVAGAVLLAAGLSALLVTAVTVGAHGLELGWRRLFLAYAGGVTTIAGTAAVVMASVLLMLDLVAGRGATDEA